MNREEWEEEYKSINEMPLVPVLKARGFSDEEINSIPAQTLGELSRVNLIEAPIYDVSKSELLRFNASRITLLPRMAEYALNGEWEKFCCMGHIHEVMQDAFEYFYDDMPDEYRRDFVIGCYQNHGDGVEECREALQDLPACGRDELPEEYRNLKEITVYRAGEEPIDEADEFFSWTLDLEVARWFMYEYGAKHATHIFKAHIKPDDVIAYSDDRNEREVIQYLSVYDVEEIETLE